MKRNRLLALILVLTLMVSLCACGEKPQTEATAGSDRQSAADGTDRSAETETPAEMTDRTDQGSPANAGETTVPTEKGTEVLVAVFSATGTTLGVAEKIVTVTGADLREIVPEEPYTSADLNYGDKKSRTTVEQNDPDARPEIAEDIPLDGYTVVFLGYPIWFAQAPRILSTFVESHDFTGITVIPFCTSGSSDIGMSDDTLAGQAGTGNWLQGKRFPGDVTEAELAAWIDETVEAGR